MDINFWVLVIQMVNLAVVIFLLRKFLFQPYLAYVVKQEEKQLAIDEAANTIAAIKDDAEKEANKILSDAHASAHNVREKAEGMAEAQAANILEAAEDSAKRIQEKASSDVTQVEKQLKNRYSEDVLQAALTMNKKLFKDESQANEVFFKKNA